MTNPYQAPISEVAQARSYATFEFDATFSLSWQALKQGFGPLVVSNLVIGVSVFFSILILVMGWIFLLPAVIWGAVRFYLNAFEGRADLNDLLSDSQGDYWGKTMQIGIWMLITVLLGLVSNTLAWVGQFSGDQTLYLVGTLISLLIQYLVLIRFILAPLFIVDRGMQPIEAMAASWQATSAQWLLFIGIALVSAILQVMGLIVCLVGGLASYPLGYLMFIAVYRQVVAESPEADAVPAL